VAIQTVNVHPLSMEGSQRRGLRSSRPLRSHTVKSCTVSWPLRLRGGQRFSATVRLPQRQTPPRTQMTTTSGKSNGCGFTRADACHGPRMAGLSHTIALWESPMWRLDDVMKSPTISIPYQFLISSVDRCIPHYPTSRSAYHWNHASLQKACSESAQWLLVCNAEDTIKNRPLSLRERYALAQRNTGDGRRKRKGPSSWRSG